MNYRLLEDEDSSVLGQSVVANPYSKYDLNYYPLAPLAHSLHVLTWPSLCSLQSVSDPGEFAFFLCPDKSLPLWLPGCEHLLLGHYLPMS